MTRPFPRRSSSALPKRDARVGEAVMMLCRCPLVSAWPVERLARLFHLKPDTAARLLIDEAERRIGAALAEWARCEREAETAAKLLADERKRRDG